MSLFRPDDKKAVALLVLLNRAGVAKAAMAKPPLNATAWHRSNVVFEAASAIAITFWNIQT
jgi:hypothetical protein